MTPSNNYTSFIPANPNTYFGFGTWVRFGAGRVPVGVDTSQTEFNAVKKTGGAKTHTLTVNEMPKHSHTYATKSTNHGSTMSGTNGDGNVNTNTSETGGGQAHNNLQPYITVYMWERTA